MSELLPSLTADIKLPGSVRYVKNGPGGRWWKVAKTNEQIHLGWKNVAHELLLNPDFAKIKAEYYAAGQGTMQDFNALRDLLDSPSKHLWMTFEDGYMWWCTVRDCATVNPNGEGLTEGHFWLTCDRAWSNRTIGGKLLAISDLPGTVTTVAGFRGTICQPKYWQTILRIIQDQKDPEATLAAEARSHYEEAVYGLVTKLTWQDFEQLIDLILARTGWTRTSTLGKTGEGIDLEANNLAIGEIAFVQVKSSASQEVLNDYVERFKERRERYARMIFAVHTPSSKLTPPADLPSVQIWTGERVASLVVRLGLGEWVESRLA